MTIKSSKDKIRGPIEIDCNGPEGNAFAVLGACKDIARLLDMDWETIAKEAMSSDYDHLIETMDKHLGNYVTFYR